MSHDPLAAVEAGNPGETPSQVPAPPQESRNFTTRAATVQALLASLLSERGLAGLSDLRPSGTPVADEGPQVGDFVTLETLARAHVERVVSRTPSLGEAARVLGIDKTTLYRRRKRYGVQVVDDPCIDGSDSGSV